MVLAVEHQMPARIPESRVVQMWQALARRDISLLAETGEAIKILYPGRLSRERGADFKNAVIVTGKGIFKGDIEVHVTAADWRAHGHYQDPEYNRVILHIVLKSDSLPPVRRAAGTPMLTIALDRYLEHPYIEENPGASGCAAVRHAVPADCLLRVIEVAGDTRFMVRTGQYLAGDRQRLYAGLLRALGYAQNVKPFAELARRVPLDYLESMPAASPEMYALRVEDILLRAAGLGGVGAYPDITPMQRVDWQLFRVRPGNAPARRIRALSYLLRRYRGAGLVDGLIKLVKAAPDESGWRHLIGGLTVACNGEALLGNSRAADISVNVLLPYAAAYAQQTDDAELTNTVQNLYFRHPPLMSNAVVEHMRVQIGIEKRSLNSARRQQGLIHLYRAYCTAGKCYDCPVAAASCPSLSPG